MHVLLNVGASALVLGSIAQLCPAPTVITAAIITASGAIIGGGISTAGKRSDVLFDQVKRAEIPPGVP